MTHAAIRQLVVDRAGNRCEYCRLPQELSPFTHHIEHIFAKQHGGSGELPNLALSCHRCNLRKGPNLAGIDPLSQQIVPLFHPRREKWNEHFATQSGRIVGITPGGRATVDVLNMNDARRVELRRQLDASGLMG